MTSNRSAKKPNFFLHNAKEKLRSCLFAFICISILCIIASVIITVGAFKSVDQNTINFNFLVVAELFYGIAFLTALATTVVCLRGLWQKTAVDMEYSVPLGTREKLFSDLSAAAFMNIAPFLLSCLIMLVGFIIGYAMYEGKVVVPATEYMQEVVSHLFGNLLVQLGFGLLAGVSLIILEMALVFFIAAGCGRAEEMFMYMILFCVIIPTGMQAIPSVMTNYSLSSYSTGESLIYCTSPVTGFLHISGLASQSCPAPLWADCIITMLVTAAIFAVPAYFAYMKRRAEQTGTVLTSRPILAVFEFAALLTGVSYSFSLRPAIIFFIGFILALEIFYNIQRPALKKTVIKLLSMAAVIALFIGIANATNKFGAVTRIPSAEDIESVHINAFGVEADIEDPEDIEKIREFQGELIDFYLDNKKDVDEYYNYRYRGYDGDMPDIAVNFFGDEHIDYTLKNGRKIERSYSIDFDNYYKYISVIPRLESVITKQSEEAYDNISKASGRSITVITGNIFRDGALYELGGVSKEDIARLAEAVRTDIKNETDEQYTHRPIPVYSISALLSNIDIYPHYTNTVALLDKITGKLEPKAEVERTKGCFALVTPGEMRSDTDFNGKFFNDLVSYRYGISVLFYNEDDLDKRVICIGYLKDNLSDEEFAEVERITDELIEHSYSFYVGEGDVTVLEQNWSNMVIVPEEYAETAASLKKYEITSKECMDWLNSIENE